MNLLKRTLFEYLLRHTDLVDISNTVDELVIYRGMGKKSLELMKSRLADNIIGEIKAENKEEMIGRIKEDLHFIINIENAEKNLDKVREYGERRTRRRNRIQKLKEIICLKKITK